jgi:hypothetical protein
LTHRRDQTFRGETDGAVGLNDMTRRVAESLRVARDPLRPIAEIWDALVVVREELCRAFDAVSDSDLWSDARAISFAQDDVKAMIADEEVFKATVQSSLAHELKLAGLGPVEAEGLIENARSDLARAIRWNSLALVYSAVRQEARETLRQLSERCGCDCTTGRGLVRSVRRVLAAAPLASRALTSLAATRALSVLRDKRIGDARIVAAELILLRVTARAEGCNPHSIWRVED